MEVVVPLNDFHFNSTPSSPYVSAPSSPKRFGDPFDYYYHYTSAPTSPTRVAALFASSGGGGSNDDDDDHADDFAFDFSGQLDKGGLPHLPDLTTADELFEKGKIRPLKPPPRMYNSFDDKAGGGPLSPRSPKSPKSPGRGLWGSPKGKKNSSSEGFDPFTTAMVEATRERGRERTLQSSLTSIPSSKSRKGSRSLSPMRSGVGGFLEKSSNSPQASTTTPASTTTRGGSRKWRLRDLLLFRSASEGRVTGNKSKDPLRKYTMLSSSSPNSSPSGNRKAVDDSRTSSFRSTDSHGSSMRRGGGGAAVSAHEIHYVSNRAASEERKKKTALPFDRKGLFGFLRLNQGISRGFRNSTSFGPRQ